MRPHLLEREGDFDPKGPLPWNADALIQDLGLAPLIEAMADGDTLVRTVVRRALLVGTGPAPGAIHHRQAIVRDALAHPAFMRALYALAGEALETRRKHWVWSWGSRSSSVLYGAVKTMTLDLELLRKLRALPAAHAVAPGSAGLQAMFEALDQRLASETVAPLEELVAELGFPQGKFISAELGPGNIGNAYRLHPMRKDRRPWPCRLLARWRSELTFTIPERDEAGMQALSALEDRATERAATALARATDEVKGYFEALQAETAFYVGCINLHQALVALGEPTCFPVLAPADVCRLRADGLHDACLALQSRHAVVPNTVDTHDKPLVIVTGANQGGKSSFLRALGVAQTMLRCGMFVAAETFEGTAYRGVVTHYRREEDRDLKHGKLDEELARLSEVVEHLVPGTLLLLNESFAATNDREGSEIARQVVTALQERGIAIVYVTHLHGFARGWFDRAPATAHFLRAERLPDGRRTFRLVEAEPLATSHGRDLYVRIFGAT